MLSPWAKKELKKIDAYGTALYLVVMFAICYPALAFALEDHFRYTAIWLLSSLVIVCFWFACSSLLFTYYRKELGLQDDAHGDQIGETPLRAKLIATVAPISLAYFTLSKKHHKMSID